MAEIAASIFFSGALLLAVATLVLMLASERGAILAALRGEARQDRLRFGLSPIRRPRTPLRVRQAAKPPLRAAA